MLPRRPPSTPRTGSLSAPSATACVATTLIAAPSSAALALTDRVQRDYQRQALHEGIGRNCKGAYYLPPVY